MTTREELYSRIKARLEGIREIRHVDLWNRNVEFIEQETPWERPAVFVEFRPIRWEPVVHGVEYRAEVGVNLHVVTDWDGGDGPGCFRLPEKIHRALAGMEGGTFADFDLESSVTNHDHEEIVENIECYSCVGFRRLE